MPKKKQEKPEALKWQDGCPFCFTKEINRLKPSRDFYCVICGAVFYDEEHEDKKKAGRATGTMVPRDIRQFPLRK